MKNRGSMRHRKNLNIDTNVTATNLNTNPYSSKNHADFLMVDNKPLISPINFHPQMFPVSSKNHFNINMDTQHNIQNYLETPSNMKNYLRLLNNQNLNQIYNLNQNYIETPTNLKEINMQNKILINEVEKEIDNNIDTNININIDNYYKNNNNININCNEQIKSNENSNDGNKNKMDNKNENRNENEKNNLHENYFKENNRLYSFNNFDSFRKEKNRKDSSENKMNLDLDIVNQSELDTMNIFSDKVKNRKENYHKFSFGDENTNIVDNINEINNFDNCKTPQGNNQINLNQNYQSPIFNEKNKFFNNFNNNNNNFDKKALLKTPRILDGKNENFLEPVNNSTKKENLYKINIIPIISPSRAGLNISPKSAFVINKKLFK
jgi:hypothetical protein